MKAGALLFLRTWFCLDYIDRHARLGEEAVRRSMQRHWSKFSDGGGRNQLGRKHRTSGLLSGTIKILIFIPGASGLHWRPYTLFLSWTYLPNDLKISNNDWTTKRNFDIVTTALGLVHVRTTFSLHKDISVDLFQNSLRMSGLLCGQKWGKFEITSLTSGSRVLTSPFYLTNISANLFYCICDLLSGQLRRTHSLITTCPSFGRMLSN